MKKCLITTLVLPSIMFANAVFAEYDSTGFYLGGILGTVSTSEDSPEIDFEESGNVGGLLMGYHIIENFGIEGNILVGFHNSFVTQSLSIAPKGTFHVTERLSFYGKAGLAAMLLINEDNNEEEDGFWDNELGYGFTLGYGVSYAVSESTYMRAAYDFLRVNLEDADNRANDADFDMHYFTLSLYYQF